MTHEFKQGDEVEFSHSAPTDIRKAIYVCFYNGFHILDYSGNFKGVEDGHVYPIKKRWRAGIGKPYFFVLSQGDCVDTVEQNILVDDERYEFGNYFKTKEQVEQAAELIKQTLKKFHDDNE